MALKFKCKSKDEIPAGLEAHYVERDGTWVLDAEGATDKAKLEEFRATNITLMKERDDLKKRFDGIDPDEVRRLSEEKQRLEEAQQLKAGETERVIEARVKAARGEADKQVVALTAERDSLNGRLVTIQIDQGVVATATKRGLKPTAIPDITSRARSVFRLVGGVPTAFEADGQTVRVGKDGASAMNLEEWIETQVSEAPHLFESNAGSGAAGNGSGGVGGGNRAVKNPFRKESWNLTAQMQLQKTDPQLAARLKAAA
jgi:hypothetical protein